MGSIAQTDVIPFVIDSVLRWSIFRFVFFFLGSVVIPTKHFVVKEMKVLSNFKPLSAYLAAETFYVVRVLRGSHYEFKRGYWLVTCGTNTRNAK